MIINGLAHSFLSEILDGIHQPQDVYRIALYTSGADLSPETPAYTTSDEVQGQGYGAGGLTLKGRRVMRDGAVAFITWDDPTWPNATITARGALIYNMSKKNRAIGTLDLGQNFSSTNGNFIVILPAATAAEALFRIGA